MELYEVPYGEMIENYHEVFYQLLPQSSNFHLVKKSQINIPVLPLWEPLVHYDKMSQYTLNVIQ